MMTIILRVLRRGVWWPALRASLERGGATRCKAPSRCPQAGLRRRHEARSRASAPSESSTGGGCAVRFLHPPVDWYTRYPSAQWQLRTPAEEWCARETTHRGSCAQLLRKFRLTPVVPRTLAREAAHDRSKRFRRSATWSVRRKLSGVGAPRRALIAERLEDSGRSLAVLRRSSVTSTELGKERSYCRGDLKAWESLL
jgi:hypothetical protein